MQRYACVHALLALCAVAGPASAQNTLNHPTGQIMDYGFDTGALDNASSEFAVVYSDYVSVQNAAWLRLYFVDGTNLAGQSVLRVTSLLDGDVQTLSAAALAEWSNTTAYLNGDTLHVELVAAPATKANRLVLAKVAYASALPGGPDDPCGICGTDDRTASNELWSGRLMPVGCTGSVYSTQSCVVSAGHCVSGNLVIQFNVPPSSTSCATVNPPAAEQFPITSLSSQNGGVGLDWAVMKAGKNGLGQTPFQRYGKLRRLAKTLPAAGVTAAMWGYGVDSECTKSQTQQTHSGPINSKAANYFTYTIDLRGGNSGSGLSFSKDIIGIVTHCTTNCPNYATRIDKADFTAAINAQCPPCLTDLDGSGATGQSDLGILLAAYGVCAGSPGYNELCDLDSDDCVGQSDLGLLLAAYGTTCP